MDELKIRKANMADLEKIQRLKKEFLGTGVNASKCDFIPTKLNLERTIFIAEIDGELAGFVWIDHSLKDIVEINGIGVRKKFRKKGIGKKLFDSAYTQAKKRRAQTLVVFPSTKKGRRFLQKNLPNATITPHRKSSFLTTQIRR
jgi:N-acetylglutamate synthase-like GNAT family acetyltransferase